MPPPTASAPASDVAMMPSVRPTLPLLSAPPARSTTWGAGGAGKVDGSTDAVCTCGGEGGGYAEATGGMVAAGGAVTAGAGGKDTGGGGAGVGVTGVGVTGAATGRSVACARL